MLAKEAQTPNGTIRRTNFRKSIKMTFHSQTSATNDDSSVSVDEVYELYQIAAANKYQLKNSSMENISCTYSPAKEVRTRSGSDTTNLASTLKKSIIKIMKPSDENSLRESINSLTCVTTQILNKHDIKASEDTFTLQFRSKVLPNFLKGLKVLFYFFL